MLNLNHRLETMAILRMTYLEISKFGNYNHLKNIFVSVLDKHPRRKTSFIRADNKPHVSKSFRKEVLNMSCCKTEGSKN